MNTDSALCAVAVLCLGVSPARRPLCAQAPAALSSGATMRVTAPRAGHTALVGTLRAVRGDTLVLHLVRGDSDATFLAGDLRALEIRVVRPRHTDQGAIARRHTGTGGHSAARLHGDALVTLATFNVVPSRLAPGR